MRQMIKTIRGEAATLAGFATLLGAVHLALFAAYFMLIFDTN